MIDKSNQVCCIVPAWRGENMDSVLSSILGQTVKPDRLVIVNDASEGVRIWHDSIQNSYDPDWMVYVDIGTRQRCSGLFGRNVGISLARTPLIYFHDDDCLNCTDHLEKLLEASESGKYIAFSDYIAVGKKDKSFSEDRKSVLKKGGIDVNCILWPSWVFEKYGMFPSREDCKFAYDWALISKIIENEGLNRFRGTGRSTLIYELKKR